MCDSPWHCWQALPLIPAGTGLQMSLWLASVLGPHWVRPSETPVRESRPRQWGLEDALVLPHLSPGSWLGESSSLPLEPREAGCIEDGLDLQITGASALSSCRLLSPSGAAKALETSPLCPCLPPGSPVKIKRPKVSDL